MLREINREYWVMRNGRKVVIYASSKNRGWLKGWDFDGVLAEWVGDTSVRYAGKHFLTAFTGKQSEYDLAGKREPTRFKVGPWRFKA